MQLPPQPTYFPYYGRQFEAYVGHRCYNSWHRRPAKYRAAEAIEWHTCARLGPYLGSWTHFYVAAWAHICAVSARLGPYLGGCTTNTTTSVVRRYSLLSHTHTSARARAKAHTCVYVPSVAKYVEKKNYKRKYENIGRWQLQLSSGFSFYLYWLCSISAPKIVWVVSLEPRTPSFCLVPRVNRYYMNVGTRLTPLKIH